MSFLGNNRPDLLKNANSEPEATPRGSEARFIGEVPSARAEDLSLAAARAAAHIGPFEFELTVAGAFPKQSAPRVLWIGTSDSSGKLHDLYSRLEAECAQVGFAKDQREFHPHLTIARLRKPRGARTLALAHEELGFESLTVGVSELLVIRSELGSQGSKYSVISRSPLGS